MGTFNTTRTIEILAALPVDVSSVIEILPIESPGVPSSHRVLEWPNSDLPNLTYDTNPPLMEGFDIFPLAGPITDHIRMLEGSIVDRSPGYDSDRRIVEIWPGTPDGRATSIRYAFFRSLWSYFTNKPPAGQNIIWRPLDRTAAAYYIDLISLSPGIINMARPATEWMEAEVRMEFAVVGTVP